MNNLSLNHDVITYILKLVGNRIMPEEFYKLRLVSKHFKEIIENYQDGFYLGISYSLGIINNRYLNFINDKLKRKKPVTLDMGLKIIKLDDWYIDLFTTYTKIKQFNEFGIRIATRSDSELEYRVFEQYTKILEDYKSKFLVINNETTIAWITRNGEKLNKYNSSVI